MAKSKTYTVGDIEKNVPLPTTGTLTDAFREMQVGDSRLITIERSNNLYTIAKYANIKIKRRNVGENQWRVWRVA